MGVGGGVLLVPAMVLLLGFGQHKAHGTSLAVIIPIVAFSALGYARTGNVDWPIALKLAAGGVVGAVMGAKLASVLPSGRLRKLFGLLILFVAARMLFDAVRVILGADDVSLIGSRAISDGTSVTLLVIGTGVAAGVLSGLMGVGGGIVLIPAMIYILGLDQKLAQGISLLVIIPVSISGAAIHFLKGNVDLRVGKWLAIGGMAGGSIGAYLASQSSNEALRLVFGLFLLTMAWLTLRKR
jgi:uncharacterized protein